MVNEKFKQFITFLRQNCITNKYDAVQFAQNSYIKCELIA